MVRKQGILTLLTFLLITEDAQATGTKSPYSILNVPQDASQKTIRQQYRQLCLEFHPDKNVNSSTRYKNKCEDRFKEIQRAYEQIGDSESRKIYDRQRSFDTSFSSNPRYSSRQTRFHVYTNDPFEEIVRAFQGQFRTRHGMSTTGFAGGFGPFAEQKSTYVQKVRVSLEDLYTGRKKFEIRLNSGFWARCLASFRGGAGPMFAYQAAVFSIPLLRFSRWLSLALFSFVFQAQIPSPEQTVFLVDIKEGYKAGTKLKFTRPHMDVVFEIEEEPHPTHSRAGDDLHTSVIISKRQATRGCTVEVPVIDEAGSYVHIRLPRLTARDSTFKLPGKGWLNRKTGERGDLIVHVDIKRWKLA